FSFSDTEIESLSLPLLLGAGVATAHRRRDLSMTLNLLSPPLSFWILLLVLLLCNSLPNPSSSSSMASLLNNFKTCEERKMRLPASPFLTHPPFAASYMKWGRENTCETSGATTGNSETSLSASLRSFRSGLLTFSFDESTNRTPPALRFPLHMCLYREEVMSLWRLQPTAATPLLRATTNSTKTLAAPVVALFGLGPLSTCLLSGPISSKAFYVISDPSIYSLWPSLKKNGIMILSLRSCDYRFLSIPFTILLISFEILETPALRLSYRFPSKSTSTSLRSLDLDPLTKCFTWVQLDGSSVLTLEPMKTLMKRAQSLKTLADFSPYLQSSRKTTFNLLHGEPF
ncbi:hypothetical protein CARUB_v10005176mg, partial [Capsella rubella]